MMTKAENVRANGKVSVRVNESVSEIGFRFCGGRPEILFHVGRVSDKNKLHAVYHGFVQRIRDAAAGKTIADGYEAVKRLVEHYETGTMEWAMTPARGPSLAEMLAAALADLYPSKTAETIEAYVVGKRPAEQRRLAAEPKIAQKIAELFGATDNSFDLDEDLNRFEEETGPISGEAGAEDLEEMAEEEGI